MEALVFWDPSPLSVRAYYAARDGGGKGMGGDAEGEGDRMARALLLFCEASFTSLGFHTMRSKLTETLEQVRMHVAK